MNSTEKKIIFKLIEGLTTDEPIEETSPVAGYESHPSDYIETLKKRATSLREKIDFKEGDVVCWKDGLKNKRFPAYGQPSIIIQVYSEPLKDFDDASFTEILDIQLGFISDNDEFVSFNYDSHRFHKYNS